MIATWRIYILERKALTMIYFKNTSSVTPVTPNYDVDIAQLYN